MAESSLQAGNPITHIVKALGEEPLFKAGDNVRISVRYPVGHYRVPRYIRGKRGSVESVIEPMAVNNEEEGFGRNTGSKGHYHRVAISRDERSSNPNSSHPRRGRKSHNFKKVSG
jgi:hypothetical protein